jgi:chromosome segregation protein
MFLRSLQIRGFKSFADKTVLEFAPGVSVIVGPNGSGKSNLVDAISWVLGEQGPRAMRGGQMADVIFAGSPQRSALGMAEVKLVIDNAARSSAPATASIGSAARSSASSTCRSCCPRPESDARYTPWSDRGSSRTC